MLLCFNDPKLYWMFSAWVLSEMQLRGPHRLLTLQLVSVCEVHVHVVCEVCVLRGQLLQCRSLEELWKKEVMSFALFHFFSWGREQWQTAALPVKMKVDVCMCEGGVNNFLQAFWGIPRAFFFFFFFDFWDLFTLF